MWGKLSWGTCVLNLWVCGELNFKVDVAYLKSGSSEEFNTAVDVMIFTVIYSSLLGTAVFVVVCDNIMAMFGVCGMLAV